MVMEFTVKIDTLRQAIIHMDQAGMGKLEQLRIVRNLSGLGQKAAKDLMEDSQAEGRGVGKYAEIETV
jgi:ribosomal protein L7/L12